MCPLTPMTPDLFFRLPARPEAGAGGDLRGTGPLDSGGRAKSRLSGRPTAIHQAALSRERGLVMLLLV